MAIKRFLVTEDSFIGMKLIKGDAKEIVEIETDVSLGGMRPGKALVEVDDKGAPTALPKGGKAKKAETAEKTDDLA